MAPSSTPDAVALEQSVYQAGLHSTKPPFTFQPSEWEPQAKAVLSANSWGYIHGNCGAGSTYRKNLAAFDRWSIVPRRLVPSRTDPATGAEAFADTSTTVLGRELPFPVAVAPIGVQKIFHPEGEVAAARASDAVGVPYTLSTASSTSIEEVAQAIDSRRDGEQEDRSQNNTPRWYQLYWPSRDHDDITISLLSRAKKAGYTALFVTLDTYVLGWRPSDMDNGYNPFIHPDRIGVEIGLTDPVFQKKFKEKHGYDIEEARRNESEATGHNLGEAAQEWAKIVFPATRTRGRTSSS